MNKADLELLGYSPKWVEYGFLTPELLQAQIAYFHTGDDRNTEHYRYEAFRLLQQRHAFSDCEFTRYVELAEMDPDPAMGRAALIDLVRHPGLTDTQWEALLAHPRIQELPRLVRRERLLKELRRPNVAEATLQRCVEEGDDSVHRALLYMPDLPHPFIEALSHRGANKAIRNLARIRMQPERGRNTRVRVRPETPADQPAIREVHEQAFGRPNEANLVDALRASPGFIPELSLVAERDGLIVGHVLFGRVTVEGESPTTELLALAPVAVRPEWQRQGIGSRLIRAGLGRATGLGHRAVILIGHAAYYPRFGFTPARALGIEPPFPLPNEIFMALPLQPGALDGIRGTLVYPPAFREV